MEHKILNFKDVKKKTAFSVLPEFKLGYNASQTAFNINRAWGWFERFCSGDESLEDQEGGSSPTLSDQQLETILLSGT